MHFLEHLLRRGFAEPIDDFHDLPLAAAETLLMHDGPLLHWQGARN